LGEFLIPVIALTCLFAGILVLINTDAAVILLLFSMLLSPELEVAQVPRQAVVIRIDDILLCVVFLTWLAKMAMNKQLGLLKNTPLNLPIAVYVTISILSTAWGIAGGWIVPVKSLFYLLKYFEYFLLYYMISNIIKSREQLKAFTFVFLLTAFIICIYAWTQFGTEARVSAPFEGESEPNTLSGYLLIIMALCWGLVLCLKRFSTRLLLFGLFLFTLLPFFHTLSRGAWIGLPPMAIALTVLHKQKSPILVVLLTAVILALPIVLPDFVKHRIEETFVPDSITKEYEVAGKKLPVTLEGSAMLRIVSWEWIITDRLPKKPFLGWGVTGVGFIDSNYFLMLGEVGLFGIAVFFWILSTIFRQAYRNFQNMKDDFYRGLSLGLLVCLMGLMVQALTANSFIIVRIMEPFWFLTAMVMVLPRLAEEKAS
jgi:hypothetical protein